MKFRALLRKELTKIKLIPFWTFFVGLGAILMQCITYFVSDLLIKLFHTNAWEFAPKIAVIDDPMPFISFFVIFYALAFAFWMFIPTAMYLTKKENFINYIFALLFVYVFSFLFYIFMPTSLNRVEEGVFDKIKDQNFLNSLITFLISCDGNEFSKNAIPSMHCCATLLPCLFLFKKKNISIGFQIFCFVFAILVCLSTVFIKQHYFIDIITGCLLAVIAFLFIHFVNPGKRILANKENKEFENLRNVNF